MIYLFILLFLSGCAYIDVDGQGLREFISYQTSRKLESYGKVELHNELKDDPSLTYYKYEEELAEIHSHSRNLPSRKLLIFGNLVLDSHGHLRYNVEGDKTPSGYHYGLFNTQKDNPLQLIGSFTQNTAKSGFRIENTEVWIRAHTDGDIDAMILWRFDL